MIILVLVVKFRNPLNSLHSFFYKLVVIIVFIPPQKKKIVFIHSLFRKH